jgi:hypothetical protein
MDNLGIHGKMEMSIQTNIKITDPPKKKKV